MLLKDAEIVVNKMAQYETFFVNMLVTEELGIRIPDQDDEYLLKDSFVMFVSYFGFGSIPLLVYFLGMCEHYHSIAKEGFQNILTTRL